jgi:glycosyltransferase involved in cell wall biosynthesis
VSIVVPCWNYGRFVGATIDSILAQDYPNFECFVVDNGSTDGSSEVIRKHAGSDPRIEIVALAENIGQLGALIYVFERLAGQFVVVVDADDALMPNFLSAHIQVHLAGPVPVGFTSSAVVEISEEGRVQLLHGQAQSGEGRYLHVGLRPADCAVRLNAVSDDEYDTLSDVTTTFNRRMSGRPWSPGTANVIRRFALQEILPTQTAGSPNFRSPDQHYLNFVHAIWGSAVINAPLSAYRLHGTNTSSRRSRIPGARHWNMGKYSRGRVMRLEIVDELLAQPEKILTHSDRFWAVIDQVLGQKSGLWRSSSAHRDVEETFARNYKTLVASFGRRKVLQNLALRFPPIALVRVLVSAGRLRGSSDAG